MYTSLSLSLSIYIYIFEESLVALSRALLPGLLHLGCIQLSGSEQCMYVCVYIYIYNTKNNDNNNHYDKYNNTTTSNNNNNNNNNQPIKTTSTPVVNCQRSSQFLRNRRRLRRIRKLTIRISEALTQAYSDLQGVEALGPQGIFQNLRLGDSRFADSRNADLTSLCPEASGKLVYEDYTCTYIYIYIYVLSLSLYIYIYIYIYIQSCIHPEGAEASRSWTRFRITSCSRMCRKFVTKSLGSSRRKNFPGAGFEEI